jgi:U3 small nucleolar RNA-associated protein 14
VNRLGLTIQGSWSGKGLKKRKPNPKFLVKTAGVEAVQRKDFGRDNVIISEKTEKRAKQFLAKDLPYPYTSVAQYEASFNTPVGAEWNSRKVHQRETMPRVIKKVSLGLLTVTSVSGVVWGVAVCNKE